MKAEMKAAGITAAIVAAGVAMVFAARESERYANAYREDSKEIIEYFGARMKAMADVKVSETVKWFISSCATDYVRGVNLESGGVVRLFDAHVTKEWATRCAAWGLLVGVNGSKLRPPLTPSPAATKFNLRLSSSAVARVLYSLPPHANDVEGNRWYKCVIDKVLASGVGEAGMFAEAKAAIKKCE